MSDLTAVGESDNWICWLCDAAVDPDGSVNSDLGPSIDSYYIAKNPKDKTARERLAHRMCNTMKGKKAPVVPWSKDLFVVDPAPIVETVERLSRKGGREVVARCPDESDAKAASEWLLDRLARLAPDTKFQTELKVGGGQYVVQLSTHL
jgi:hypothetical protein